jgi:hypothetical protein
MKRVCTAAFSPYFIFRDPRDVVVSHVFYVTDMEARHVHHDYYQSLPDFNARLRVSILGRPEADIEFPNIADRFAPYLGWLDQPCVMKIHFEDLIHDRPGTLNRIIDHLLALSPKEAAADPEALESSINPKRLPPSGPQDRRMEEVFHRGAQENLQGCCGRSIDPPGI